MISKKISIISALCLASCLLATPMALAADTTPHEEEIVAPCMEYISNSDCKLTISGGTATITALVSGNSSLTTKCQINLKLQEKSGTSWKTVGTWLDSKAGSQMSLSKTKSVTKGKSYRAMAIFTVWSGTEIESKTVYSAVKTA